MGPDPIVETLAVPAEVGGRTTSLPAQPVGPVHAPSVAGYELLAEIGRGGMGVVYRARQLSLNRIVALKVILAGEHASPAARLRFLTEAEALAGIRHPNVVPVYEFGTAGAQPFFSMELLEGNSLVERLNGTAMAPNAASELVEQLARAVEACHQAGIVHRDLKPANVLFGGSVPKITDFGLAKRGDSSLTATQAIMGTPAYMAPEQAEGRARDVGPETDVYSLGAILYECLTGRAPFQGETAARILEQVRSNDPESPRRIQPTLPRDLETVCLKCLEKEPAKRYRSASDLADELARFRDGRPVSARPVGRFERGLRWARRNPTRAGLVVALAGLILLATVTGFAVWAAVTISDRNDQLASALELANTSESNSRQARLAESEARKSAEEARAKEATAREELEKVEYVNRIDLAYREWRSSNLDRVRELLSGGGEARRGWEWNYVRRLCEPYPGALLGHRNTIGSIAYSPDGRWLASTDAFGIKVWSVAGRETFERSGVQILNHVAVSDGGKRVAGSGRGFVYVFDTASQKELYRQAHPGPIVDRPIALSADGTRLAVAGPGVRLLDLSVDPPKSIPLENPPPDGDEAFAGVSLSSDGRYLAAARPRNLWAWNARTGQRLPDAPADRNAGRIHQVAFRSDGVLFVGSVDGRVRALTYSPTGDAPPDSRDAGRMPGPVVGFAIESGSLAKAVWHSGIADPMSSRAEPASAEAGPRVEIRALEGAGEASIVLDRGHNRRIQLLAIRPDGRQVATVDRDYATIKLWDATTSKPDYEARRVQLEAPATDLAVSANGRFAVSWAEDRSPRVWNVDNGRPVTVTLPVHRRCKAAHLSDDYRTLITADAELSGNLVIRTFELPAGKQIREARRIKGYGGEPIRFSRDGRKLLIEQVRWGTTDRKPSDLPGEFKIAGPPPVDADPKSDWGHGEWPKLTATVINGATGNTLVVTPAVVSKNRFHFTADGSGVAIEAQSRLRIWDSTSGVERKAPTERFRGQVTVAPDGTVAVWTENAVEFVRPGRTPFTIPPRTACRGVDLSPDGRRAVMTVGSGAQIWDTDTGRMTMELAPGDFLRSAWFSTDGTRVIAVTAPAVQFAGFNSPGAMKVHVYDGRPLE